MLLISQYIQYTIKTFKIKSIFITVKKKKNIKGGITSNKEVMTYKWNIIIALT